MQLTRRQDSLTVGANVGPPEESAYQWAIDLELNVSDQIDKNINNNDRSRDGAHIKKVHNLLFSDPNISEKQLNALQIPVFVMASNYECDKR
jgi:hypothetical protein